MNRETKEECHAELQQNFMEIVNKMVGSKCDLPDEFQLFYKLQVINDRYGNHIMIAPYLTREKALDACPRYYKWDRYKCEEVPCSYKEYMEYNKERKEIDEDIFIDEDIVYQSSSPGKYGNRTTYKVIDSETRDFNENHGNRKHVACCDIEGW